MDPGRFGADPEARTEAERAQVEMARLAAPVVRSPALELNSTDALGAPDQFSKATQTIALLERDTIGNRAFGNPVGIAELLLRHGVLATLLDVNPLQNACRGVIDGSRETWYPRRREVNPRLYRRRPFDRGQCDYVMGGNDARLEGRQRQVGRRSFVGRDTAVANGGSPDQRHAGEAQPRDPGPHERAGDPLECW
jgi:hypothetical protein